MKVHLIDGTYDLFRVYYAAPGALAPDGREVGAVRALLRSLLALLRREDATHIACAFDHVIESFRNELFPGYKTGDGVEPQLLAQFDLAERAVHALGLVVWPMVELEADDALASGAERIKDLPGVEQVVLCSSDKDLCQCVVGERVVCWDRFRDQMRDEAAVRKRFGIAPGSIPDWLALVGDAADGIPGIPGWGELSASRILGRYERLEAIPADAARWDVPLRRAAHLCAGLQERWEAALLYRRLATLRTDAALEEGLDELEWKGARPDELERLCRDIGDEALLDRIPRWRDGAG